MKSIKYGRDAVRYRNGEIALLTKERLDYVWSNLRPQDKIECELQGMDENNYQNLLAYSDNPLAGLKSKTPFCCFGVIPRERVIHHWFVGTTQLDDEPKLWFLIHPIAKAWIAREGAKHFGKKQVVEVWEGHTQSIKWLKRLGFGFTPHARGKEGERLMLMERVR